MTTKTTFEILTDTAVDTTIGGEFIDWRGDPTGFQLDEQGLYAVELHDVTSDWDDTELVAYRLVVFGYVSECPQIIDIQEFTRKSYRDGEWARISAAIQNNGGCVAECDSLI